jgi:PKD repeat protein
VVDPARGAPGVPAADGGCTTIQPTDTCSATAFTPDSSSVTLTLTANNYYPPCGPGEFKNCIFQYFVRALATGYNSPGSGGGTCNGKPVSGVAYVPASGPISCTITYPLSTEDGSAYPYDLTVQVVELDGEADLIDTGAHGGHGFTVTRAVPAPVAAFTYVRGAGPREFVFTSTSRSRLGGLHHSWDFGDGTFGSGVTVTHTFAGPGTYDVELEVSDKGPYHSSATQPVDTEAPTVLPTLLALHLATDPATDPGSFDLGLDDAVRLPGARHGDEVVVAVAPGTHRVAEAATGVQQTYYDTTLTCRGPSGDVVLDTRAVRGTVTVPSGVRVDCTFTNRRTRAKHCVVPDATGLTLRKATKALRKAHCRVGKVSKRGRSRLVVTRTNPSVGAVRAAKTKVKVTLRPR